MGAADQPMPYSLLLLPPNQAPLLAECTQTMQPTNHPNGWLRGTRPTFSTWQSPASTGASAENLFERPLRGYRMQVAAAAAATHPLFVSRLLTTPIKQLLPALLLMFDSRFDSTLHRASNIA